MTYVIINKKGGGGMRRVLDPPRLERYLARAGLEQIAIDHPAALYRCPAGRDILRQGEILHHLYVFVSGRAKVVRLMENGRTMLHAFYRGIALLGDLELCRGDPAAQTSVRAITDVWLIGFPLDGRREALMGDARLLRLMCGELAAKLEQASQSAAQNLLYPLAERLMMYMGEAQTQGVFSESLTGTAELLGVSYRHLLRTLRALEGAGRVRRVCGGYRLEAGPPEG
jgi:CRP/FNR family putative post-exponential-phase nitrogen-starvation transcriptional regulator